MVANAQMANCCLLLSLLGLSFKLASLTIMPLMQQKLPLRAKTLAAMRQDVEKRYALLLAAQDSAYVKKYGGYFNVFVDAFGDVGETWDLFRVVEGEFPDEEELKRYDGFVVSGSSHDAYGDELWVLRLCRLLQTLDAMQKRVLGVCFGHQVICRALGGKVGKAHGGWEIGIKELTFVEDLLHNCRFMEGFKEIPQHASLIECHQDEILEPPIDAKVIAYSERTAVEAFCIEDHILGIQGHPEYTKDILDDLITRLAGNSLIDMEFATEVRIKMEAAEPDRKLWEKMCKSFLKGTRETRLASDAQL